MHITVSPKTRRVRQHAAKPVFWLPALWPSSRLLFAPDGNGFMGGRGRLQRRDRARFSRASVKLHRKAHLQNSSLPPPELMQPLKQKSLHASLCKGVMKACCTKKARHAPFSREGNVNVSTTIRLLAPGSLAFLPPSLRPRRKWLHERSWPVTAARPRPIFTGFRKPSSNKSDSSKEQRVLAYLTPRLMSTFFRGERAEITVTNKCVKRIEGVFTQRSFSSGLIKPTVTRPRISAFRYFFHASVFMETIYQEGLGMFTNKLLTLSHSNSSTYPTQPWSTVFGRKNTFP